MRIGLVNGDGAICDICGKQLLPKNIIKIYAKVLSENPNKAKTGCQKAIGKMDICKDCYNKQFKDIMQPIRTRKKENII